MQRSGRRRQHSRPWNEQQARRVLDEWKQSGDTIAEFSRKRGLVPERLYLWRKRFAETTAAPERALALVPATVVSTDADVVMQLPNGVVIEIANVSPKWIAAVVSELTRSSS
jgi:transposase-like protein